MLSADRSADTLPSLLFAAMGNPTRLLGLRALGPLAVAASLAACGFDAHPKSGAVACEPQQAACCPEGYVCVGRGSPAAGGVSPGTCWYKEDLPPTALVSLHDYTPAIVNDPGCLVTDWLPPNPGGGGTQDAGETLDTAAPSGPGPDTGWADLHGDSSTGGGGDPGVDAPLVPDASIGVAPETRTVAPDGNGGLAVEASVVDAGDASLDSPSDRTIDTSMDLGIAGDAIAAEVSRDQALAPDTGGVDAPPVVRGIFGSISAGSSHTCAVVRGAVMCWGNGAEGKLGYDTVKLNWKVPNQVPGLESGATVVSAGSSHTCAVVNGGLKCWGFNHYGQLGDGTTTSRDSPVQVVGLEAGVTDVCAGSGHTCAVVHDKVQCWGSGQGQLGDGTFIDRQTPAEVADSPSPVAALACGETHTCAIANGSVYCWGDNVDEQVDHNAKSYEPYPFKVGGLTLVAWSVGAGSYASCAVINGGAMCWGSNDWWALGYGGPKFPAPHRPVPVAGLGTGVTHVSNSNLLGVGCAIVNGGVQCWGHEDQTPVPVISANSGIVALDVGDGHACVATVDQMMCWGNNGWGQVGDGTYSNVRTIPVVVQFR